jgi:hypothetical protein
VLSSRVCFIEMGVIGDEGAVGFPTFVNFSAVQEEEGYGVKKKEKGKGKGD